MSRSGRTRRADLYGEHKELIPRLHRKPRGPWTCRTCKFGPIDKDSRYCVSCGRDWWGNPGVIPDTDIPTPRGRLFKRDLNEEDLTVEP